MNKVYNDLIRKLVIEGRVNRNKIWSLISELRIEHSDPVFLKKEMEDWYTGMGINDIIGKDIVLDDCPFSKEEIEFANENGEMIFCVPKDVNRKQLGELFRIESWALDDTLIEDSKEKSDLWLKTKATGSPEFIRECGIDITRKLREEKKVLFSLEIYLVFIARYRFLFNALPDSEYWIWICKGRYDRSGMLIAGFDRNNHFNVHGWMPQFSAGFLGARYGELSKKDRGLV